MAAADVMRTECALGRTSAMFDTEESDMHHTSLICLICVSEGTFSEERAAHAAAAGLIA
jgi:hypothetical protein